MNILLQNQRLTTEVNKLDNEIDTLKLKENTLAAINNSLKYQVKTLIERNGINEVEIEILIDKKKEYWQMLLTHEANKKKLDELVEVQCMNGNWNYDAYMYGMANGMILSKSCIDDIEPEFLDAPKKYIHKKNYFRFITKYWNKFFKTDTKEVSLSE